MTVIKLHLLTNPKFLGDKNQSLGIKNAFEQINDGREIQTQEWNDSDAKQLNNLQAEIESTPNIQHIILSAGDHGLKSLEKLNFNKPNVLSVWSAHQPFPEIKTSMNKINIMALPKHAIDSSFRQNLPKEIELVETIGVAHNVSKKELGEAYTAWQTQQKNPIKKSHHYIGVILGGDAPDSKGKIKYFSAEESKLLAQAVSVMAKTSNSHILITNGPRTGKFNSKNQEEQGLHTGKKIDETSQSFINELEKNNISYQFFDFVFGQPSAYKPILGVLAKDKNNIAVVTGESTSMVTEMSECLNTKFIIANVGSMNDVHHAHVLSVKESGIASFIHLDVAKNKFFIEEAKNLNQQTDTTAALRIATAIHQKLNSLLEADKSSKAIHFFASRHIGVNKSSPNTNWRYGKGNVYPPLSQKDEHANALKNIDVITNEFKLEEKHPGVILQSQYGKGISVVTEEFLKNDSLPKDMSGRIVINGDGLFTTLKQIPLLNKSGDAHAIVFESPKAVGILVGAWKCLGKDIIGHMLEHFDGEKVNYSDITVHIGPGLGKDSYSLGNQPLADLKKTFGEAMNGAVIFENKKNHLKCKLDVHTLMKNYGKHFGFKVNCEESYDTFDKKKWKVIKAEAIAKKNPNLPVAFYGNSDFFSARLYVRTDRLARRIAIENNLPLPEVLAEFKGDYENTKNAGRDGRYDETGRCLNGVMRR